MSHKIVKITVDDDGVKIPAKEQVWHFVTSSCAEDQALCTGEYLSWGGTTELECVIKEVERGGITCPDCLSLIKRFKEIKL